MIKSMGVVREFLENLVQLLTHGLVLLVEILQIVQLCSVILLHRVQIVVTVVYEQVHQLEKCLFVAFVAILCAFGLFDGLVMANTDLFELDGEEVRPVLLYEHLVKLSFLIIVSLHVPSH